MSRVPFARYFKRLTIGRAIGIVALIGIGFGISNVVRWYNVSSARLDLDRAVSAHRVDTDLKLAELAYSIARPLLTEYDRGNFERRLDYVREPELGLFVVSKDRPVDVAHDLTDYLRTRWAGRQMGAVGLDWNNHRQRWAFLNNNPAYRRVEIIYGHLSDMGWMARFVDHADNTERVQELAAEFAVLQIVSARLLNPEPNVGTEG